MDETQFFRKLKELFDAKPDEFQPDKDQIKFIDERDEIEKELSLSFAAYVDNYDLIQEYGLDLKLIQKLEWFIVFYLENHKKTFMQSEFYRKFKDHEVVQRAYSEYERKMELKND